ncbi:hypothetical protein [Pseudomonas saliphila]|uniref:hypothetical protein n=1 Tax=Pseudomonas saliphila TaxID=2586906 RepID=UPI00123A8629|nr:hypothetical protein [Pseudomonas saliphila]
MIQILMRLEHDAHTTNVLVRRANEILSGCVLDSEYGHDLKDLAQQYASASPHDDPCEEHLKNFLGQLREKKQITEAQAEAFLCTPPPSASLQNLQSFVLLAALEHQKAFGDLGRTLRAMSAYRLLVEDRAKTSKRLNSLEVEKLLPIASRTLESLLGSIDLILGSLAASHKSYAQQRLMPVRRILEDVVSRNLKNKRTRRNASEDEGTFSVGGQRSGGSLIYTVSQSVSTRYALETDETPGYIELSLQTTLSDVTQETSEYRADHQTPGVFLAAQAEKTAPASLRRSYALSAMHAKVVAGVVERREKRLVCLTNRLTKYEVGILLSELASRMEFCDVSYMLYLVLATGRKPEKLLQARQVARTGDFHETGDAYRLGQSGSIYWLYRYELPPHRLPEKQQRLLDQQKAAVVMPVPCAAKVVRSLPDGKELELQAEELLKRINKANSTKLSVSKIADHLANYLHRQGVDDVLIALIIGSPDIQEAGLYYTQYDTVSIYRAYQRYLKTELRTETPDPDESKAELGGSQLVVKEEAVVAIFDHLQKSLQRLKDRSWIEVHNRYVMYTIHLLNIATGHRPVIDPFDDIDHIDLISKKIFISDKESRLTSSSARTLVLPDTAVTQIKLYNKHLERLHIQMQSLSPTFGKQLGDALNGKGRLFFFVQQGDMADEFSIVSVSPKSVEDLWAGTLGLPSNWHRHFLRSYLLRQKEVTGESIDTWMGHAKPGQEGLTRYSGMSIKALETIALVIEQLFSRLGIIPLTDQGRAHE